MKSEWLPILFTVVHGWNCIIRDAIVYLETLFVRIIKAPLRNPYCNPYRTLRGTLQKEPSRGSCCRPCSDEEPRKERRGWLCLSSAEGCLRFRAYRFVLWVLRTDGPGAFTIRDSQLRVAFGFWGLGSGGVGMVVSGLFCATPGKGFLACSGVIPWAKSWFLRICGNKHGTGLESRIKPDFRQMRGSKSRAIIHSCSLQYYYPKLKYHLM